MRQRFHYILTANVFGGRFIVSPRNLMRAFDVADDLFLHIKLRPKRPCARGWGRLYEINRSRRHRWQRHQPKEKEIKPF